MKKWSMRLTAGIGIFGDDHAAGDAAMYALAAQSRLHRHHARQETRGAHRAMEDMAMAVKNNRIENRFSGLLSRAVANARAMLIQK